MRLRRFYSAACACAGFTFAQRVHADPIRLHAQAAAAHAVSGYQKDEFGWGASGSAAAELPFGDVFGVQLQLSTLWLSQGSPPYDPKFARENSATANAVAVGLRLRPFGAHFHGHAASAAGVWLAADVGAAVTNGLKRGLFDLQLGYDFFDRKGRSGVGPMLSLVHVTQPDRELRPEDANVVLIGLHALFDFGPGLNHDGDGDDRDHDGIADDIDACPDVPEDKDGFQDGDGCPEPDNDRDGLLDPVDHCPNEPEDKDGFEDSDGCPDTDNDKDGIADKTDQCPDVAEDKDNFEDADGCPEPDNDKDGILDAQDLCPNEPETVNGYADNDGCPDEDQVRVVGDKIVLDDRVHFYVNSFVIRKISYPLLSRLTKLIADHPEYSHVSVEGHADERGPDSFNQKLSEDRARAVMDFLVKHGIVQARLSSIGFGSSRPLVDKKSEYALLLNRRVEFTVTRQLKADGSPMVSTPTLDPRAAPAPPPPIPPHEPGAALPHDDEEEEPKPPAAEPAASAKAPKKGTP